VVNERVLLCHEQAFADPAGAYAAIREVMPEAEIIVVPASQVSLADAVQSYLFNAQLVTLPAGEMALIVPLEAWEHGGTRAWLGALTHSNGPIRRALPVDLRQSMANGGGPACLRLRVVADPATVDQRFLLDEAKARLIAAVIERHWPERIETADLGNENLAAEVNRAHTAMLDALDLAELG
jgi:succinylarginine dihydrolase